MRLNLTLWSSPWLNTLCTAHCRAVQKYKTHKVFVTFSPIMRLLPPLANLPPNYFLGKLIIFAQHVTLAHQAITSRKYLIFVHCQEFVELMIKREAEKETQEDLKQVFRVFDKVVMVIIMVIIRVFDKFVMVIIMVFDKVVMLSIDVLKKILLLQDGNGFVSTSEIKFVLSK